MMSLIITLFICLFSFSPTNIKVMDREENNFTINDNVLTKNSVLVNNYIYIGFNELVSYDNYLSFIRKLKTYDYFPMTNVTVENFLLGQSARIDVSNLDISVGDFVDGQFNLNTYATSNFEYIEFSYDGSLDYIKYFEVTYKYGIYTLVARSAYSFLDGYDSTPICNYTLTNNGSNVYYTGACIKYNYSQFASLLSTFATTLNNYDLGYNDGRSYGYQEGYADGYTEANNTDEVANSIFTGIFEIGLLPVNVFLTIFNFEVFGINISGIVSGLLTMSVVVIIVRFLLGGKNDDK